MKNISKSLFVFTMLCMTAAIVRADDSTKPGSIKGKIVDSAKSPIAKMQVRLVEPKRREAGGGRGRSTELPIGLQSQNGGMMGGKIIKTTATDANGEFKFLAVTPGYYSVEAGNNNVGWVYTEVTLEGGKEADVGEQSPMK